MDKKIILAAIILFFALLIPIPKKSEADLKGQVLVTEMIVFQGNSLAQLANPFVNSYISLGSAANNPQLVRTVSAVITAYSSTPWETWGNPYITASGTWVEEGIIANNMLAFGTKVRIPEVFGDRIFVVQDRMHRRKGNYHVDVWFPSYQEALNFGAKRTYIEIIEG